MTAAVLERPTSDAATGADDTPERPAEGPQLPRVDPDRVAYHLERGRSFVADHAADCLCSWCLSAEMDQVAAANGQDPSRYWDNVPSKRGGYRCVPWWLTPCRGKKRRPRGDTPHTPRPVEVLPQVTRDVAVVPFPATCLAVGVWARVTGVDEHGAPLVLSGAVTADPRPTILNGRPVLAVEVDTYWLGQPARVVFVDPDAVAHLVDDPAEHAARACHAADGRAGGRADIERVEYYERKVSRRKDGTARRNAAEYWVPRSIDYPTAAQMTALESDTRNINIRAVWLCAPGGTR